MSAPSKASRIVGWVLSVLVAALLTFSASLKFQSSPEFLKQWHYPPETAPLIGAVELTCAVLFLVPKTSVFGGLLLLAYLGGAVATHVRGQDGMWFAPIIFGIVAWVGLCLREPRLWKLVPFRSAPPQEVTSDK